MVPPGERPRWSLPLFLPWHLGLVSYFLTVQVRSWWPCGHASAQSKLLGAGLAISFSQDG